MFALQAAEFSGAYTEMKYLHFICSTSCRMSLEALGGGQRDFKERRRSISTPVDLRPWRDKARDAVAVSHPQEIH